MAAPGEKAKENILLENPNESQFYSDPQYQGGISDAQGYIYTGGDAQWGDYSALSKSADGQAQLNPMSVPYLAALNESGGLYQDEANFVQNFAVQQQPPFLPSYPYLTAPAPSGFQQPFANQLYSQFMYPFQQFIDPQAYFALPEGGYAGGAEGEGEGEGEEGNPPPFPQLYQVGNALAGLTLQDQHQILQHQLYQQQLLQLQQQQQILHQQLLAQLEQEQIQAQAQAASPPTPQTHTPLPPPQTAQTTSTKEKSQTQKQAKELVKEAPPQQSQPSPQPNSQTQAQGKQNSKANQQPQTQQTQTHTQTQPQTQAQTQAKTQAKTQAQTKAQTQTQAPQDQTQTQTPQAQTQPAKKQTAQAQQPPSSSPPTSSQPPPPTQPNSSKAKQAPPPPEPSGPKSWAAIISAPPKPTPPPSSTPTPTTTNNKKSTTTTTTSQTSTSPPSGGLAVASKKAANGAEDHITAMQKQHHKHLDRINPSHFEWNLPAGRFFVIKSYSEDDIHKSIKYNVWASTDSGNRRLDAAYRESAALGPIYLFFSVNASGQFCGMAQMTSPLDYGKKCELWAQDKWNGQFTVTWIFVKDIPNAHLRHIRLINNEGKPVTNSRDTQEIFMEPGREVLRIFTTFQSKTSILDDFSFYDKRQELMKEKKSVQEVDEETGGAKPENELLPLATGENRKQRQNPTSPPPSLSPLPIPPQKSPPPSQTSPLSSSKGVNGTSTTNNKTSGAAPAKGNAKGGKK